MPKQLTIPTREDIRQLPRWARVAFAIRVVRRVQPIFAERFPDATSRHLGLIENALSLAESAAKECFESDHPLLQQMAEAAAACEKMATTLIEPAVAAAWVALGAARAVEAARIACRGNRLAIVDEAMRALEAATEAVGIDNLGPGLHGDWQKLQKALQKEEWTNRTPAPAKLFGRL